MTPGEKNILIKNLCCRLPYGVKAHIRYWSNWDHQYNEGVYTVKTVDPSMCYLYASSEQCSTEGTIGQDCDFIIEPYLFPLSSMTEEQRKYISDRWGINEDFDFEIDPDWGEYFVELGDAVNFIEWLNENHFDYRDCLIDKGLALDATNLNIY